MRRQTNQLSSCVSGFYAAVVKNISLSKPVFGRAYRLYYAYRCLSNTIVAYCRFIVDVTTIQMLVP